VESKATNKQSVDTRYCNINAEIQLSPPQQALIEVFVEENIQVRTITLLFEAMDIYGL